MTLLVDWILLSNVSIMKTVFAILSKFDLGFEQSSSFHSPGKQQVQRRAHKIHNGEMLVIFLPFKLTKIWSSMKKGECIHCICVEKRITWPQELSLTTVFNLLHELKSNSKYVLYVRMYCMYAIVYWMDVSFQLMIS